MRRHPNFLLCGGLILFASLASASDSPEPEVPQQASVLSSSIDKAQNMLSYALGLVGVNYKYGGASPETGLDCSGFVSYVYKQAAGLVLPHNAKAISMFGQKIAVSELQPGDLVFYKTMRHAYSHVGIYLGDNRFVHAASAGGSVEVANMNDGYWTKRFNGARRMLTSHRPSAATSTE